VVGYLVESALDQLRADTWSENFWTWHPSRPRP
jgi:hypothetical protein